MAPTFAALAYIGLPPGVTLYGGYPVARVDGLSVTFAGVAGSFATVSVSGVASATDTQGRIATTSTCGKGLCVRQKAGGQYEMKP